MSPLEPRGTSHVATDITTPRTLAERAYLSLRHDVICGKLAPGEKLRVEHLKDQYQVGASTLREALSLLVSDALVTAEGQRGFRVAPISLTDLEDVTNTRVMLETEALRQSIRKGDARWEALLTSSYQLLTQSEVLPEMQPDAPEPLQWEIRNKNFHDALISAHDSPWTKYMLAILYRHGERYRGDCGRRRGRAGGGAQLRLAGVDDFALLELEDTAGGNSRGGQVNGMACPLGAHYLPVPGDDAREVQDLLEELGLRQRVAGRWQYDERHLCHSPQERLFFQGEWQEGLLPVQGVGEATLAQYRRFAEGCRRCRPRASPCPCSSLWMQNGLRPPIKRWML
jgi:DNA-binding GntR family transcriptional regulator